MHSVCWCFICQNVIAVKLCDDSGCCLLLISSACFDPPTVEIVSVVCYDYSKVLLRCVWENLYQIWDLSVKPNRKEILFRKSMLKLTYPLLEYNSI